MSNPTDALTRRAFPLAAVALGLLGLAAAVLVVAQAAQAIPGTGKQVVTDVSGDVAGGGGAASDLTRVGTGSAGGNLYYWMQVNTPGTPTSGAPDHPISNYYQVAWSVGTSPAWQCYWYDVYWNTGGGWGTENLWKQAGSCGSGLGVGTAGTVSAVWLGTCNELQITVPLSLLGSPPAGTVTTVDSPPPPPGFTDLFVANAATDALLDFWVPPAAGTGGTYNLGDPYPYYQTGPGGLTVVPTGDNQVTLTWTAATDPNAQPLTGYKVYRNSVLMTGTPLAASATSWVDNGLVSGTLYTYVVKPINCVGENPTGTTVAITPDFNPAVPTAFSVGTPMPTSLKLTWTASAYDCPVAACTPPGTGASGVQGYAIWRGFSPGSETFFMNVLPGSVCVGTACAYVNTALTELTNYCYKIRAYDGYGAGPNVSPFSAESCLSTTSSVGAPPPPPPPPPPSGCGLTTVDFLVSSSGPLFGESVSFTDKTTITGGSIAAWAWDFGDGIKATDKDPVHIYQAPGDYSIRLTTTDSQGCTAFADKALKVGYVGNLVGSGSSGAGTPIAYAGEDQEVKESDPVLLHGTVNGFDTASSTFSWKQVSGDPVVLAGATTDSPSFTAPLLADRETPEYYIFGLKVTAASSISASDYVQVTVLPLNHRPVADAGADVKSAAPGRQITLDASGSSDADMDVLAYTWEQVAGPALTGFPATQKVVTFTVPDGATSGFADFRLKVADGLFESQDTVRVWFAPPGAPAAFKVVSLSDGSFQFESLVDCSDCVWDFGDGETATGKSVVRHTYADPGDYTVKLASPGTGTTAEHPVTVAAPDVNPEASVPAASSGLSVLAWVAVAAAALLVVGGAGWFLWTKRRKAK